MQPPSATHIVLGKVFLGCFVGPKTSAPQVSPLWQHAEIYYMLLFTVRTFLAQFLQTRGFCILPRQVFIIGISLHLM